MDEPQCPGCRERDAGLAELAAEVARLRRLVEELQRSQKRQAAPFSKGVRPGQAKKPGRKPGEDYGVKAHRQPPPRIDEVYEAALPRSCPDCGGQVKESEVAQQYQTEIPRRPIHRQFNVHIGCCQECGSRVQGRHPLQTSDALGAAAAQLGSDAQAAIVELNKQAGLPHGKIVRCFASLFGIRLSRGGSVHTVLRAARRSAPLYEAICADVRRAPWDVPDETGWRVGGTLAWLHALVAPRSTAYVIDPTRSGDVAERILGKDYAGIMIHDGWSPYDHFVKARHQQCLAHLMRRCRDMLAVATRAAVRFPRRVLEIFKRALGLRERHVQGQLSAHGLAVARGRLQNTLDDLVYPPKTDRANERLAQHLWKHRADLFTFLRIPGVDATNWRGELAMRFGVILRKIWGGNRTWRGAQAQAVLMSLWRTCWQRGHSALDFLSRLLRGHPQTLALPP
jgi:transposase